MTGQQEERQCKTKGHEAELLVIMAWWDIRISDCQYVRWKTGQSC